MDIQKKDLINKDFRDFLELLNKHKVEYCIVGGYAVGYHAEPRFTKDLDVFVSISGKNASGIVSAFKEFGIEDPNLNESTVNQKGKIFRIGIPPNRIEVINDMDGVAASEVFAHKVEARYGDVATFYIGIDQLIKNKKAIKEKKCRKSAIDRHDLEILKDAKTKKIT